MRFAWCCGGGVINNWFDDERGRKEGEDVRRALMLK